MLRVSMGLKQTLSPRLIEKPCTQPKGKVAEFKHMVDLLNKV
jgi:hypothetical protein